MRQRKAVKISPPFFVSLLSKSNLCAMKADLVEQFRKITTVIFDVDGVFTDGTLQVTDQGINRTFSIRDGYAVQMALKTGLQLAVISGGKQENIRTRLASLGIQEIHLSVGTDQKPEVFEKLIRERKLKEEEVAYMGDDIPDLLLMKKYNVLKACPADAEEEILEIADFISTKKGGEGAVRDLLKNIMQSQNSWMKHF
jgi:3-deoxy-D-manno-octulosonate 8-phosphate phosphatase (KDO 8-P phosphatase)